MNFSQLESFVALSDTGSFTEAAYAIHLTQSAVSHALAALETELGVTLVERNRKGVVALTHAGEKIIPHVRALLAQAEAIEQEAKAAAGLAMGKLRVGNTLCFCPGLVASVLNSFEQQYPDVDLVLFEGTTQEVEGWLAGSIVDVAFMPMPAVQGAIAGMDSMLITMDELCVVVAVGHRLHTRKAITPSDLGEESFVMPKTECTFKLMEQAGLEPTRIKPSIRYQVTDSSTILAMVREGLGIALMPRMTLPAKLDGVVALSLNPQQPLPIGISIRSREMASPAAKLFVQTAQAWAQVQTAMLVPA